MQLRTIEQFNEFLNEQIQATDFLLIKSFDKELAKQISVSHKNKKTFSKIVTVIVLDRLYDPISPLIHDLSYSSLLFELLDQEPFDFIFDEIKDMFLFDFPSFVKSKIDKISIINEQQQKSEIDTAANIDNLINTGPPPSYPENTHQQPTQPVDSKDYPGNNGNKQEYQQQQPYQAYPQQPYQQQQQYNQSYPQQQQYNNNQGYPQQQGYSQQPYSQPQYVGQPPPMVQPANKMNTGEALCAGWYFNLSKCRWFITLLLFRLL